MSPQPISRRNLLRGAVVLGAAGAGLLPAASAFAAVPKIYIDPGHGGSDPGAIGNGLQEKALTLAISLQTRDILKANWSVDVRMSRTTDATVSLSGRTSDANAWGADIFVSIHINSGGGTGFESYRYTSASAGSVRLQDNLHTKILAATRAVAGVTDRGKKAANFHVLRETTMPAVLTENLFIDTAYDAGLLKRADFITATANGHAQGIAAYFGLGGGGGGSFSTIVDNASSRFTGSTGWAASTWSAQKYDGDYRYATPNTTTSDAAWYKVAVPSAGNYFVDVWHPSDAGYNNATPYIVATSGGNQSVVVDQRTGGGAWRNLGSFHLNAGDYNAVGISRWTTGTGYVVADAVRIRK
ncbi:N-acetylmuramoyl-L-alanine amidase [Phytomonospora sp. NPDC050363]|uniref:N-acetylmuramoyl-L-alanine amidase n=1 Tax=Phytomonospora sp. NPDC050363 TaxID=3155642 RepID=UPI0033FFC918